MADSEKADLSTKEAKAKTSLLDEDFSKDFLSSWKSMSTTGGDDMDFNFEPVNKGKNKAFDFGMDMNFSLDDAFDKMSSFKIDMPDLDFSSSPKKSTKSEEKPEADSAKGNRLDKHDNFEFSFDFNGLGDFSLDAPSTKGGKSPSGEKKNKNDGSEFEDLPKQVTNDKKETAEDSISKGPAVCEDPAFSKIVKLIAGDVPSFKCASKSTVLTYPVQQKELDKNQISYEKELADNNSHKTDHQSHQEREVSSNKSCYPGREGVLDPISVDRPPQSIGLSMPIESAEVHMSSGTGKTLTSVITEETPLKEETCSKRSHKQLKEMDFSANTRLVDASAHANVSEGLETSSPQRKGSNRSSEGGILAGELPAAVDLTSATEKPIIDKSPKECSMDKPNIDGGKKENGKSGNLGSAKLCWDNVAPYATCDTKVLSSSARSSAEIQIPVLKVSSAPFVSGPSAAKAMLMGNKVPGASRFSFTQATKDGGKTEPSAFENSKEGLTHVGSVDKSCSKYGGSKHNEKRPDDNPSSCSKELVKPDLILENSEKITAANSPQRDQEDTLLRKDKNEMSVNIVSLEAKEAKTGLPSLESEKMINNINPSGFKNTSLTPPEQGNTFGNQGQGQHKDKISSISSFQKLNNGQGNKLSSQRIEKKMLALRSLKLTRSTTTDKQLATPNKQRNFGSLGNSEKSTRQAELKVSPVSAEQQTPQTLPLKRKPSEAADMDPAKLHTPKRVPPNESRMSKASAREVEGGDQAQGNFLEGSRKNVSVECTTPKFDFDQEVNLEALQFSMMVENDENVEKAEACAKELDNICNMLKKKHEEAKEILVRALVNNNYLLMLNHPIYEEKILAVQRIASRLMTKELQVEP